MAESAPHPTGGRLAGVYTGVAQALLGCVIAFAAVNAALFVVPSLRATTGVDTPMALYGLDRLMPGYPGWTREAVMQLHEESRVVFTYEPVVQFRIKPIAGTYVNESPEWFRANGRTAPWPIDRNAYNVFVFGGSTTFGWLLADRDTIVSHLQDELVDAGCGRPVHVYNFGQPSYISSQESLLFQMLARRGSVPDLAVFIDGLNEFFFRGEMSYTQTLKAVMEESSPRRRLGALIDLPLYKLAERTAARFAEPPPVDPAAQEQLFRRIIAQWIENKTFAEGVAQHYGAKTLFVWQPVPTFKYELTRHFLYEADVPQPASYLRVGGGYAAMSARRQELERQENFLWLADMQEGRSENLYVDRVHYSAAFSRDIARGIQRRVMPMIHADSCGVGDRVN